MKKKPFIAMILVLALSASACGFLQRDSSVTGNRAEPGGETFIFTDSAGREVELPRNIERITPSGPLAQIVLYTLAPDKMIGLASALSTAQLEFMDSRFANLPVFGNFYAGTFSLESVMLAGPQLIIDIGQVMPSSADDMDSIQRRTGIPAIFIHFDDLETMISGYATLGGLLGAEEQAQRLINYIKENIFDVIERAAAIPPADRVRIFYGQHNGLTAVISGTIHSDVIDFAGGYNVANVQQTIRGGAAEISMEQLLLWDPDVILFAPGSIYDTVTSLREWSQLRAIREGRFYEIPFGPYNWMGRPPSVNRLLGIKWLANLLYPQIFPFDMAEETREFYRLFYHHDITNGQIEALLRRSTLK